MWEWQNARKRDVPESNALKQPQWSMSPKKMKPSSSSPIALARPCCCNAKSWSEPVCRDDGAARCRNACGSSCPWASSKSGCPGACSGIRIVSSNSRSRSELSGGPWADSGRSSKSPPAKDSPSPMVIIYRRSPKQHQYWRKKAPCFPLVLSLRGKAEGTHPHSSRLVKPCYDCCL